jgi:5-(carboxyamino)imidazole ribonucleotide mutase
MKPLVGIIMGSSYDWETMRAAAEALDKLAIPYETRVVSAHRTPDLLFEYASAAQGRGIEVIVAGAGGAAHLPGMVASKTTMPVLGVPLQSKALNGLDSLLSIVQMPAGIPVSTFAIGLAGATNAGLAAAATVQPRPAGGHGQLQPRPRGGGIRLAPIARSHGKRLCAGPAPRITDARRQTTRHPLESGLKEPS